MDPDGQAAADGCLGPVGREAHLAIQILIGAHRLAPSLAVHPHQRHPGRVAGCIHRSARVGYREPALAFGFRFEVDVGEDRVVGAGGCGMSSIERRRPHAAALVGQQEASAGTASGVEHSPRERSTGQDQLPFAGRERQDRGALLLSPSRE